MKQISIIEHSQIVAENYANLMSFLLGFYSHILENQTRYPVNTAHGVYITCQLIRMYETQGKRDYHGF